MERNIRILKWISACIGWLPASSIWIIYFARVSGSVALGAGVFAIGMVVAAVFDLPSGVFSDRVGRKVSAIVANVALLLCLIVYAFAHNWWELMIAGVLDGLGMAFISGNNSALMHESLAALGRGDEFAFHYGRLQGGMNWAALGAAIVASALAPFVSLRWIVVLSIPSLIPAVLVAFWLKEPERHIDHAEPLVGHLRSSIRLVAGNRKLRLLVLGAMLSGGIGISMFQLRPIWIQHVWPVWALGAVRGCGAAFAAAGTWWGGAIVNRWGSFRSLIVSQLGSSLIDITMLIAATVVSPALLTTSSFAFGLGTIGDNVLLQAEFNDKQRATLGSITGVGMRVVYALAALGFGLAPSHSTAMLVAGELLMIVATGMYVMAFRSPVKVNAADKKGELCIPSY